MKPLVSIAAGIFLWAFLVGSPAPAQEAPAAPNFSAQISSLFPDRDFATCTQGHHEEPREVPHYWFVRPHASGDLTVDVSAFAVNVTEESGSIIARLYDGDTLLGEVTVIHPTGPETQDGDENTGSIGPVQVAASAVLRLEVTRGVPVGTPGEGHHYKLAFSEVGDERVDVGLNSPVHKYLEGGPQVFHVNVEQGENFRLAMLADPDPNVPPQATTASVEVRDSETGEVLIPEATVTLPHTLAADGVSAGTLVVDISQVEGHYRLDKQSGSDIGTYFDTCPPLSGGGPFAQIPIVDAHSQVDTELYTGDTDDADPGEGTPGSDTEIDTVLDRMAANGVTHTILSPRVNDVHPEELLAFSSLYPRKITQAVVTKGECQKGPTKCQELSDTYASPIPDLDGDDVDYGDFLDFQIALAGIDSMGEYLSYHAAKPGIGAGEVKYDLFNIRSQGALSRALSNGWPFIVHIEFAALERDYGTAERDSYMDDLEDLLAAYPQDPFPMIHMGQLEYDEVRRLIENYPNIYFLTSHSNPLDASSSDPWVNMFKGTSGSYTLKAEWKTLIEEYPDRFIFAIDNVFFDHWDTQYSQVISLWRDAFATLPNYVAHAVAHCNAERLWNLPPQGGIRAQLLCLEVEVIRVVEPIGLNTSLKRFINHALEAIQRENFRRARRFLRIFIRRVGRRAGRRIPEADAARLTAMARQILERLP
ncbi:hypothetical protein ACFLQ0_02560 [Nitrospinota bacterium]